MTSFSETNAFALIHTERGSRRETDAKRGSRRETDVKRGSRRERRLQSGARILLCSYELSVADRQKLQAAISLLCSVTHFLQDRHRRVGAGLLAVPELVAIAEPSAAIAGQANVEIATNVDDCWNESMRCG